MKHFAWAASLLAALSLLSSCSSSRMKAQTGGVNGPECQQLEQDLRDAPKTCHKDADCYNVNACMGIVINRSKVSMSRYNKWQAAKCLEGGCGGARYYDVCKDGECQYVGQCGNHQCEKGEIGAPVQYVQACPEDCTKELKACNRQKQRLQSLLKAGQKCSHDADCTIVESPDLQNAPINTAKSATYNSLHTTYIDQCVGSHGGGGGGGVSPTLRCVQKKCQIAN